MPMNDKYIANDVSCCRRVKKKGAVEMSIRLTCLARNNTFVQSDCIIVCLEMTISVTYCGEPCASPNMITVYRDVTGMFKL